MTGQPATVARINERSSGFPGALTHLLNEELLEAVDRPGQYLGNEWGTARKSWESASVHLALAFPDLYELGMSNFGQRILYQLVNAHEGFLADRSYAPGSDMEALMRQRSIKLWGWEARRPLSDYELVGFSLQYELTFTNVLNMLDLAGIPVRSADRASIFPLVFGGGPSAVNPEPMSMFMDFFVIGDGEEAVPAVMECVRHFLTQPQADESPQLARRRLLYRIATTYAGIYVPQFYAKAEDSVVVKPVATGLPAGEKGQLPKRIERQVCALNSNNQPVSGIVPYLALVHDRPVLEVRRGCDRGCRFCQPGYTALPVRERSAPEIVRLSKEALDNSGQHEYSMLSLCVSDYTALHDAVRALNREHSIRRASMSFPSQRADRMNFDIAEELKLVRKSGITLAPEAGTQRLRAVINKGLNHDQIISAIETAYRSGWTCVKLYFMLGLPTEGDEDLTGILEILKEATARCQQVRRSDPTTYRRGIEFTCTISNFVPKPFTPFQWYGQITEAETRRRQAHMKDIRKAYGLNNVTLNFTDPSISLLEAAISRGDRTTGEIICKAWEKGAVFDAWNDRFKPEIWQQAAADLGASLPEMASAARQVGSSQPWSIVHAGLNDWWLVREWERAMAVEETPPCTEHTCHACGVCTELDTTHILARAKQEVVGKNPFVKELNAASSTDSHPSLFVMQPPPPPGTQAVSKLRFEVTKTGELRFISHLDLWHLLCRAARRAGLNLAFSEGFNPSPRLSLALSLPIFQESLAEVGEAELVEPVTAEEFRQRVNRCLPFEVRIVRAKAVAPASTSLGAVVGQATYSACARCPGDAPLSQSNNDESGTEIPRVAAARAKIMEILARQQVIIDLPQKKTGLMRQRRKRQRTRLEGASQADIRPGIFKLSLTHDSPLTLDMILACGSTMHVKPQDVLGLIDSQVSWRVTRVCLSTPAGVPLFDAP